MSKLTVKKVNIDGEEIEFVVSSGNVYKDIGYADPEDAQVKSQLAMCISSTIKEKGLTQQQAADRIGVDQAKVSKITRGLLSEFSIERLMGFVRRLDFDIKVSLTPRKVRSKRTPTPRMAL